VRILHLLSQAPGLTGSGVTVRALMGEAGRRGHENHLLCGISPQTPVDDLNAGACTRVEFEGGDLPFPIVGMSDVMPYPSRTFRSLTESELDRYRDCFVGKLKQLIPAFQPDLIHSHHLWILTALAKTHFPEIPAVATSHGTDLRQFVNCGHLREEVRAGCARLEGILALSGSQKEEILRLYGVPGDRVHVAGTAFDPSLFRPGEKARDAEVEIAYVGKLCRAKGLPCLLRALERIRELPWRLDLVGGGSGEEREECLGLAHSLGSRVRVHGQLPQEAVARVLSAAHVFVLSSFFEGLPLVLLEALSSGCRVAATALPGVMDVVGDFRDPALSLVEPPRLVRVDQAVAAEEAAFEQRLADALAVQIRRALEDPAPDPRRLDPLLQAYTWPRVFDRVSAVYEAVTGRPPRGA